MWNIKEFKKWDLVLHWCEVDVHGIEKEKKRKFKMQNARLKTKGFKQVGKHTSSSGLVIDSSMRERICFSTRLR